MYTYMPFGNPIDFVLGFTHVIISALGKDNHRGERRQHSEPGF
jgi:hypothetical protein